MSREGDGVDWFDIQEQLPGRGAGDPLYDQWIEKAVQHARTSMTAPGKRLNERKQWKHIIQVVEQVFGVDLNPELIASVMKMHSGELNLFVQAYLEYRSWSAGSLTSPPKNDPEHVRPRLLKYRSYSLGRSARVYSSWTEPEHDPFDFMGRLGYLLLYCHGVAIDNPLVELADEEQEWGPSEPSVPPRWSLAQRLRFQSYLAFIYASKPLIEKGILVLLEPRGAYAGISANSE